MFYTEGIFSFLIMEVRHLDFIVVGLGIAGLSFCQTLRNNNRSFVLFNDGQKKATANSGGVLNPLILKFFTAVKDTELFYPEAIEFYQNLSINQKTYAEPLSIYRIFTNAGEQNNWSTATDKNRTRKFLNSDFIKNTNAAIQAPYGFGEVVGVWRINVSKLLQDYATMLSGSDQQIEESFDYNELKLTAEGVQYRNYSAKHIVFCDGMGAIHNPYFPKNRLFGNEGEYVIIHAPELKIPFGLKGPVYVIPLGEDLYKAGATFRKVNHSDNDGEATETGISEIVTHLKTMLRCEFQVVDTTIGIRPSTSDRNPLVGRAIDYPEMYFLNGLGSRGFLMAPLLAKTLYQAITENGHIPKKWDINRDL